MTFLVLFLGGSASGALGGWLFYPYPVSQVDVFDKTDPQMALNTAITAVPSTIVATALAAYIFSRLSNQIVSQGKGIVSDPPGLDYPLVVCMLLVLLAHFALTLVVPHEGKEADHLCGTDEVKMAAFVGIGAAPVLFLMLILVKAVLLYHPLVMTALALSTIMSSISLHTLIKRVLPKRASYPPPQGKKKNEARWFGTIANSSGPRLLILCVGCGLVMAFPFYITTVSVLLNLTIVMAVNSSAQLFPATQQKIILTQASVSSGMIASSIIALTIIYLFYLKLGRLYTAKHFPSPGL